MRGKMEKKDSSLNLPESKNPLTQIKDGFNKIVIKKIDLVRHELFFADDRQN